jgi:hypothetical protein
VGPVISGVEVYLVDASRVKNVTGRKTDVQDARCSMASTTSALWSLIHSLCDGWRDTLPKFAMIKMRLIMIEAPICIMYNV